MNWIKTVPKTIAINIFVLVLGLGGIEVVWRIYFSNDIFLVLNVLADVKLKYDVSSLYPTADKHIEYTRDRYGLRGDFTNIDAIDVVVLGGSTTDQRYVDDQAEWVRVFQEETGLISANAGVDGHSTFGHLKSFHLWFPKIPRFNPKIIIFYVGVNDFYKEAGYGRDNFYEGERYEGSVGKLKYYLKTSHLFFLYRLLAGIVKAKEANVGHKSMDFDALEITETPLLNKAVYIPLMQRRLETYYGRLNKLVDEAVRMGSTPIFVTQTTLEQVLYRQRSGGTNGQSDYDEARVNGLDRFYMRQILNETTMKICRERVVARCIDLGKKLQFSEDDFYDFVHNTPSGARKIGEFVGQEVNRLIKNAEILKSGA